MIRPSSNLFHSPICFLCFFFQFTSKKCSIHLEHLLLFLFFFLHLFHFFDDGHLFGFFSLVAPLVVQPIQNDSLNNIRGRQRVARVDLNELALDERGKKDHNLEELLRCKTCRPTMPVTETFVESQDQHRYTCSLG